MICKNSVLFLVMFFFGGISAAQTSLSLTNSWQFEYNGAWYPATVPFSIHTDLLNNKLIEDPFYADNESRQQWIGRRDWEYKCSFIVGDSSSSKMNQELVFRGLDTYADVYLNDSLLLTAGNMFREWRVPVKNRLHSGTNTLRIHFYSAENKSIELFKKAPLKLPGEERVMIRKAQFQFGWDWAPRFLTCGLEDVLLESWDGYKISRVLIRQNKVDMTQASLTTEVEIQSEVDAKVNVVIKDKATGVVWKETTAAIKKGRNIISPDFNIDHPHLWWCNGLGVPYLYHFVVEVSHKKNSPVRQVVSTGLRSVKLVLEKDSLGQTFYFMVNGIPVFMKGANYVPQDVFSCRVTDEKYASLLRDVREAGMNMLRVWGGGLYQRDAFYRMCDENGILVWQDFMFAGGMYPYDSLFLDDVKEEATGQVKRLANHPCIALWCGNNECSEGWHRWGWQDPFDSLQREEISTGYNKLFNGILPDAVKKYSLTDYVESSPRYGRGDPRHTTEGDAHNWFVWHDGEPFENYELKVPRFMSEFGFQSIPSMETLRSFAPDSALSLTSAAMVAHQKHSRGFAIIQAYMKRQYGSVPADFASFVALSQQLQSTGMVIGVQAHRKAYPYCMGSLLWQLNDCWPSISWSMIDYYGRKKIVYETVKREFLKK